MFARLIKDTRICMQLTKTYEVYDYWGYRATGSQTHNNGSTMTYYNLWDLDSIGDCEITGQIKASTNKGFGIGYNLTGDTTDNNFVRIQVDGGGNCGIYNKKNGTTEYAPNYPSYTANTWITFKIKYENGVLSITDNNNSNWQPTNPLSPQAYFGIQCWNSNKTVDYKDLIVKKL